MPELPVQPDLDQLRRQARELLRAAARGDPDALARVHTVSDQVVLWGAQLAIAREYGFRSWPALKAEVDRRRSVDLSGRPPLPGAASRVSQNGQTNAGRSAGPPRSRPPRVFCPQGCWSSVRVAPLWMPHWCPRRRPLRPRTPRHVGG